MKPPEIKRVGIIGLGKMGLPIGRHVHQRRFPVTGYDMVLPALKAAATAGIQPVNSAKAVAAASDLVIVAVGFDHEVESAIFVRPSRCSIFRSAAASRPPRKASS